MPAIRSKYIALAEPFNGANLQYTLNGRLLRLYSPLLDLILFGEVLQASDRGFQPGHGEEGCQVGRVGGDDDEPEQPPGGRNQPAGQILEDSQVSQNYWSWLTAYK